MPKPRLMALNLGTAKKQEKIMKKVTAYEALDGSLHAKKTGAASASILHLGRILNGDSRGESIGQSEVAFLIQHRNKIIQILNEIDAPEESAR